MLVAPWVQYEPRRDGQGIGCRTGTYVVLEKGWSNSSAGAPN